MKKSLIVTTQHVYNYGAVLQTYGFSQFLNEFGWSHEFLDRKYHYKTTLKDVIRSKSIHVILHFLREQKNKKNDKKKFNRFDCFVKKNIPLTKFTYGEESFKSAQFEYDVYISGGDQLFNRSCLRTTENFLNFGDLSKPRISYSTSFGSAEFNDIEKEFLYNNLSQYKEISLREMINMADYPHFDELNFRTDLDGSMLLSKDEWTKVEEKVTNIPENGYIFVYELLQQPSLNDAVQKARASLNLPVVVLSCNMRSSVKGDVYIRDAGPGEFLYLFDKATAVLTTSFHGTCFSVVFQKPFFSVIGTKEKRINNLLDSYGLSNQYGTVMKKWDSDVDFSQANKIINKRRIESYEYLKRYLDE